MIQESKFLGGDMEHTHLVKGLDYALLQKVINLCCFEIRQSATAVQEVSIFHKMKPFPGCIFLLAMFE